MQSSLSISKRILKLSSPRQRSPDPYLSKPQRLGTLSPSQSLGSFRKLFSCLPLSSSNLTFAADLALSILSSGLRARISLRSLEKSAEVLAICLPHRRVEDLNLCSTLAVSGSRPAPGSMEIRTRIISSRPCLVSCEQSECCRVF